MTAARRTLSGIALTLIFSAPNIGSAQTQIVSGLPSVCANAPALEDAFDRHTRMMSYGTQLAKNYGFERNEVELENAANLPAAQIWEGKKGIRKLLFGEVYKGAREELARQAAAKAVDLAVGHAVSLGRSPGSMSPEMVERFRELSRYHPTKGAKYAAAVEAHLQGQAELKVKDAMELLDDVNEYYSVADDVSQGKLLEVAANLTHEAAVHGLKLLGNLKPQLLPATSANWVGFMLSVDEWAWMQAYKSYDAVRAVRKLTESNVMQLELLKRTSNDMRVAADELRKIRPQLAQLAKTCDRTKLVKKGGSGAGKWIVGTLVLGGVGAAGAYYYAEEQKKLNNNGGGDGGYCLSNRNCIVGISSCSCSSGGQTCGYSTPGSDIGGSCPCKAGLSCNNGRCEGRTGRCPF